MSKCDWCGQEMTAGLTCTGNTQVEFPDGESLPSVPSDHGCHDCKTPAGGFHHPGCDVERCPRCGGQLIGCGCLDEEEA